MAKTDRQRALEHVAQMHAKPSKVVTHHQSWLIKNPVSPEPVKVSPASIHAAASTVAREWLKHPANKLQLTALQAQFDVDGDGIEQHEFKDLLRAAGSKADADLLFEQIDADGDGKLSKDEIKALGRKY